MTPRSALYLAMATPGMWAGVKYKKNRGAHDQKGHGKVPFLCERVEKHLETSRHVIQGSLVIVRGGQKRCLI